MDEKPFSGAIEVRGYYTVEKEQIRLWFKLVRNEETLAVGDVRGSLSDRQAVADKIVGKVKQALSDSDLIKKLQLPKE
jgi:hypothetical protein